MDSSPIITAVQRWVETLVVGLNLCPFAKRELVKQRVRYVVSMASDEEALLGDLRRELDRLDHDESVETTLLIHPAVLQDFFNYTQFLPRADRLVGQLKRRGVYQIASFHPDYEFAGTAPDDAENFTNRSPYPMLHVLREASLATAIDNYPDTELIPERNIAQMEALGADRLRAMLRACMAPDEG
ncbi:MAG: DUF1415 domain-containing protein [Rhodocyclaceae bacterium]|nr:DUF1415 domain-containing protein [Rhodocyclaceae bacterium]